MASCTRPPSPPPAPSEDLSSPGGEKKDPSMPTPEKENPPAPLAPAAADASVPNHATPARKKRRPLVPMTDEEQETLMDLKERYQSATKERRAQEERLDELVRRRDELLFQQRCLAARLNNRVVILRANIAHVRHQRRLGWTWKAGEPVPEEITKARQTMMCAHVLSEDMSDAMAIGLDTYFDGFLTYQENKKKMDSENKKKMCSKEEVDAQTTCAK